MLESITKLESLKAVLDGIQGLHNRQPIQR